MKISSGNRSRPGRTSLGALLILAVLGCSWLVLRADVPQVASGTWAAAGEVAVPSGAASVALADGRVVVAGGTSNDTLSPAISTYDPASGAWARVGELVSGPVGPCGDPAEGRPRAGRRGNGFVRPGVRHRDLRSGERNIGPRRRHDAGAGRPRRRDTPGRPRPHRRRFRRCGAVEPCRDIRSRDRAEPGVPDAMSTARVRATATTLLDGHVLVAGGSDGTQRSLIGRDLRFSDGIVLRHRRDADCAQRSRRRAAAGQQSGPHRGRQSAGAAVASAELYADWRDGFSTTPNPMSAARAGGIAGGLQPHEVAFVAGGGATTGEYYGYATVKTDRDDYWPGEPVTVSGSGWQPGETVALTISEDADTHYDFIYSAVADAAGNITNSEFAPIQNEIFQHFGKRFYVTARGAASQALNTFTDGKGTISGTIRNSVTNAVIAGATITCSNAGPNACNKSRRRRASRTAHIRWTINFQATAIL